ncbi:hypothetical protein [Burkholderia ubonensis]|nr:hypothetical protein [Burkholderia ubonensis]
MADLVADRVFPLVQHALFRPGEVAAVPGRHVPLFLAGLAVVAVQ